MDKLELNVDVTEVQIAAAKLARQFFFWRIVTDNGKVVDQFDPITGTEQQFPNWVTWIQKSPTDPFYGNPAFSGVREAFWIPVVLNQEAFFVGLEDASSIILYRKNYRRDVGTGYTVYCIGRRWETDNPKECIYHICPPTRYHKADGSIVAFHGCVSIVTDPLGKNGFDDFIDKESK